MPADDLPELQPGLVIGSYRVKQDIEYGGGLTRGYRVEHILFGREATLLHFNFGTMTRERFLHWITLTGSLEHPVLLPILDCGEYEGFPYALLGYVEGRELAAIVRDGSKQDLLTLLRLYRTVASGLAYCHSKNVAHRDVKEEHIVVDSAGRAHIKGFFIASHRHGDPIDAASILETPANLSPEVLEYEQCNRNGAWRPAQYDLAAADVFAFGHSLFRVLTGDELIPSTASIAECHQRIRSREPFEFSALSRCAPEPVVRFVERCLEFDVDARYQTAAELESALDAIINHMDILAGTVSHMSPVPGRNLLLFGEPVRTGESGRYFEVSVLDNIGSGAFADVYEVSPVAAESRMALKVLRPSLTKPELVERFRREAMFLAQVEHENVVKVHAHGRFGSTFFITMELLEGESLLRWMGRTRPRVLRQILDFVHHIGRGLDAMHRQGLIHRDLKPENVQIVASGTKAVITDFGIVHGVDATRLTQSGEFWGTPLYAAPEQILGETPTPATDLYALGVIFYELLCDQRPFDSDSPHGFLRAVMGGSAKDIRDVAPDVPKELADIVMKMVHRQPGARYQSCAELLQALGTVVA
jgi:serine/threonine-protein kinase